MNNVIRHFKYWLMETLCWRIGHVLFILNRRKLEDSNFIEHAYWYLWGTAWWYSDKLIEWRNPVFTSQLRQEFPKGVTNVKTNGHT